MFFKNCSRIKPCDSGGCAGKWDFKLLITQQEWGFGDATEQRPANRPCSRTVHQWGHTVQGTRQGFLVTADLPRERGEPTKPRILRKAGVKEK